MEKPKMPVTFITREDWLNVGKCLLLIAQSMSTHGDIKRLEKMLVQLGAKKPVITRAKK